MPTAKSQTWTESTSIWFRYGARVVRRGGPARSACSAVLLAAAILKAYGLTTTPTVGMLFGSRWFETALIQYEFILAAWLLSGVGGAACRKLSLTTFIGFACVAMYLGLSGSLTCGCFGRAPVNPWWTFTLDMALVMLLSLWRPALVGSTELWAWRQLARGGVAIALGAAVFVVPVLAIMASLRERDATEVDGFADSTIAVLTPADWIGKPFPLIHHIDIDEQLAKGDWIVVLYHHDCSMCQESLPKYIQMSEPRGEDGARSQVALVEIPPYAESEFSVARNCRHGRLSSVKEWFVATPVEIRLRNGPVVAATSGKEIL